jgi:polyketide cyclase/dehydrase/lipid transport protein
MRSFVLTKYPSARYQPLMLTLVLSIVGGLVGLVILMAVVGMFLPRDHVAARRATLAKPPETVWRALTDLDAHPSWRRGVKSIERLSAKQFRETSSQGSILFEITEDRANELRITRIADDKLPFGGRWIFELAPDNGGTRLTITEDGFVKNPIFRFLSKTVFSTTATLEKFLVDLGAHLGVPAAVEPTEPSRLVRASSAPRRMTSA